MSESNRKSCLNIDVDEYCGSGVTWVRNCIKVHGREFESVSASTVGILGCGFLRFSPLKRTFSCRSW